MMSRFLRTLSKLVSILVILLLISTKIVPKDLLIFMMIRRLAAKFFLVLAKMRLFVGTYCVC